MQSMTFGKDIPGYTAGDECKPGVIVLQEWWGVTDLVKEQATYLSEQGFRTLVPDIYKGKLGVTVEEASHNMETLDWGAAVDEICQAAAHLKDTGSPAVGVTGFCMGGALSLLAAQHCDNIVATAPFYGTPNGNPVPFWDPSSIGKPTLMQFGENDGLEGFADPATAEKVRDELAAGGADVQLYVYSGVGHGFMNSSPWPFKDYEEKAAALPAGGFSPSNPDVQAQAWSRLVEFLNKNM